jgi:hypothetical protein
LRASTGGFYQKSLPVENPFPGMDDLPRQNPQPSCCGQRLVGDRVSADSRQISVPERRGSQATTSLLVLNHRDGRLDEGAIIHHAPSTLLTRLDKSFRRLNAFFLALFWVLSHGPRQAAFLS